MDLETPRLNIRDLAPADLDAVHAMLDVDLSMDSCTRAERARWLEWTILGYEQHRRLHQPPYGDYGVVLKGTDEVIGLTGLVPSMMPFGLLPYYAEISPTNRHRYSVAEVGLFWAVATAHQRNGYAAEAAAALVGFGFTQWHLRRIVATTEHTNVASIGVMRRLGMRIDRNPSPAPFFLQVVGIIDNLGGEPEWPTGG
jgi:[ribosomal protein S5]-alanine N-acetyltransferase